MERILPPQYRGWQELAPGLRRRTTTELIAEVQDGSPERRLAALSVVDLAEVPHSVTEDWIRTLPDVEANELAGAIPIQRAHASCRDELRWLEVARLGYERRRLPTFLVVLFTALESMEERHCAEVHGAWQQIAGWLGSIYDHLVTSDDEEALDDISLFVFENYLDRDALFDAFCGMVVRHRDLAVRVSTDPGLLLPALPAHKQRLVLQEAAANGGRPFRESWATLNGIA
jgi:hypothetical protein